MTGTALWGADVLAARCPRCSGRLEAHRTQRLIVVGGKWTEQGEPFWTVRCVNGHQGVGDTLGTAIGEAAASRGRR